VDLVERALGGDERAFAALVGRHRRGAHLLARSIVIGRRLGFGEATSRQHFFKARRRAAAHLTYDLMPEA